MDWDLGSSGLLCLAAMSIVFGLLAQLLSWRADPLLGSVARTVAARSHRPTLVVPSAAGPVRLTPKTARRTGVGSGAHFMV